MLSRRGILRGLAGVACVRTPHAAAQAAPLVGWLGVGDPDSGAEGAQAFLAGMKKLGYLEGRDFSVHWRWLHGDNHKLPEAAAELAALGPRVIIAEGSRGVEAAAHATRDIPIVAPILGEPAATRMVGGNFGRPHANVTGTMGAPSSAIEKQFEIALEIVPGARRVGALLDVVLPAHSAAADFAAKALRIEVVKAQIAARQDFAPAFRLFAEEKVKAVVGGSSALFRAERHRIVERATAAGLPTVFANRVLAEAGALVAFGIDAVGGYARAAYFVDRLLRGTRVVELPVEQPQPTLTINLRTASRLAVQLPATLLARADEVIE
jgi:putative tryptophan/tyrosine transport system substrate-binding protein